MDVVWAEVYLPGVISGAKTVAAGLGPRLEGVGMARGESDCGGEVVALPIPEAVVVLRAAARRRR